MQCLWLEKARREKERRSTERRIQIWRDHPEVYFRERLGIELWHKQLDIVHSVRDNRKTHVKSGHKTGKTLSAGGLVLWFLDCWEDSKVVTTSATWSDVTNKLWGSVRSHYRRNGQWFGVKINDTSLKINDDHYALGLSPNEVEPFAGHNAPHVLVLYDEASSITKDFFDAGEAEATRMLAIGNPLVASGPFYQFAKDPEWHHIKISCWDHPNVVEDREVIPGGPTLEWVEGRRKKWGERSPLYLTRVCGEFPEEAEDTLFPLSLIQKCFERYRQLEDKPRRSGTLSTLGLDVARKGGDKTIGYETEELEDGTLRAHVVLNLAMTDHYSTRLKVSE
jgi:phage terminase large subunit